MLSCEIRGTALMTSPQWRHRSWRPRLRPRPIAQSSGVGLSQQHPVTDARSASVQSASSAGNAQRLTRAVQREDTLQQAVLAGWAEIEQERRNGSYLVTVGSPLSLCVLHRR
ncbi:hypothetical protein ZWY2020_057017 [Hordeum vulgare]|nr:hypothetical protein ZWY2020_057017 [Hordeum vulgare]